MLCYVCVHSALAVASYDIAMLIQLSDPNVSRGKKECCSNVAKEMCSVNESLVLL